MTPQEYSRWVVNYQLENKLDGIVSSHEKFMKMMNKMQRPSKVNKLMKIYINMFESVYEDMIIDCCQTSSHRLDYLVFCPFNPLPGGEVPYRAWVMHYNFNARTCGTTFRIVCSITTHAMERMVQRQGIAKIIDILNGEIDLAMIGELVDILGKRQNGSYLDTKFKISTKTGWACGVFENNESLITTWYPR